MKKTCVWLVGLVMLVLLVGCSRKVVSTDTSESTETISNEDYRESLLESWKKDGLITSERELALKDIEEGYRDLYAKAKKIRAFDVEKEQGGIQNSFSNDMKGGLLVEFNSFFDMAEMIDKGSNLVHFDDLGVNTNDVAPVFYSNNDRFFALQLNKEISEGKLSQFKDSLFFDDPLVITDWQLVASVTGEWSGAEGLIQIDQKGGYLYLDTLLLEIKSTKDQMVYTHEVSDKKSRYQMVVTDKGLTILPSYKIEQKEGERITGGDLAPIELVRNDNDKMTIKKMLGDWQSVEDDYPAYLRVRATDDINAVDVYVTQTSEGPLGEADRLTLELEPHENLTFLNEEQSLRYVFSYHEKEQWIFYSGTTNPEATGTACPYILERSSLTTD